MTARPIPQKTQLILSSNGLPPPCAGVAAVRYPPGWDMQSRRTNAYFQIVHIATGSAELRTDRFFLLEQGQLVFLPPHLACGWKNTGTTPLELVTVMVQPGAPGFTGLDQYLSLLTAGPDRVCACRADQSLSPLVTTVSGELAHGQPALQFRVAGLLLEWVTQAVRLGLAETSRHDHGQTERHSRLEKARWFIENNYHRPLLLKDIAAIINISPGHCEELFRRELQTAPMRHLLAVRLEKAKTFLPDPSLKIKDVARLVGFIGEHHFSRMFKQHTGQTPLEFRRAALGR